MKPVKYPASMGQTTTAEYVLSSAGDDLSSAATYDFECPANQSTFLRKDRDSYKSSQCSSNNYNSTKQVES